jgi:hypothetical protein
MNTAFFFHSVEVMLGYGRGTKVTSLDNVSNGGRITLLIKGTPYEFKDPLSNLGLSHYSLLSRFIFNECSIEQVYQLRQWLVKTPVKAREIFSARDQTCCFSRVIAR